MNNLRRIAKNTALLFIAQVVTYILTFFYTIYIARFLGAEGFGILAFALAFAGIFSILADLGLNTLIVREVSRNKSFEKKILGNIVLIKIVFAIITFLAATMIINMMNYAENVINVVYIILIATLFFGISGIFNSIFQAHEKIIYMALGLIINSFLMFLGVLFALYYNFDVMGFAFIYLFSNGVFLVYSIIICLWKFFIPEIEFNWNFWKFTIKEAVPFGLTGISLMIYTYIDSVMLSLIHGNEVVGWYNAAYRLVIILMYVPGIINITIFPSMSKFYIYSKDLLQSMKEIYFKMMIIIGIPTAALVTILADEIILFIFGTEYLPSIIALQIIVWTIIFTFSGAAFIKLLEATNKQLIVTKISIICVIVNILLNLVLIPRFSYIGACISTVLTEMILVGSIILISYRIGYGIYSKKILFKILKVILSTLIMSGFILYFKRLTPIVIILAPLIYMFTLYFIRGIDEEDKEMFKEIVTKN
ncbi:MAG: flippase [Methanobacteriaceae archaeon]